MGYKISKQKQINQKLCIKTTRAREERALKYIEGIIYESRLSGLKGLTTQKSLISNINESSENTLHIIPITLETLSIIRETLDANPDKMMLFVMDSGQENIFA